MSMTVPPELEYGMAEVQTLLVRAMSDLERLKTRHVLVRAALSHHKHEFGRDITAPPTTYVPTAHTHAAYADITHTHATYATTEHTHTYASNTHTHTYNDYQPSAQSHLDISRTTGGPV